eukprot:Hpha_TRINITY_DN15786_c2_g8::TRINITY_DN15786_c2_g8_i1::g.37423::m.37423
MASAGALQGLLELSDACNDPVRNALREAAGSGDMADIVLEAEDGERCPAIKALLAIRSPVFRQMFAGNFADAAESSVRVPIRSGEVVRSLIEFCYTNETELLTWESWKTGHALLEEETDHLPACHVRLCALVALAVAGDFYSVPTLCERAVQSVRSVMKSYPKYLCFILSATRESSLQCIVDLRADAFDMLRRSPGKALLHVEVLCEGTLEQVLRDECLEADEALLFDALARWAKTYTSERRVLEAKALAVLLDYGRMAPSFLVEVVSTSGLVAAETIQDAFQKHALYAEQQGTLSASMRWSPWESTSGRRYFETRDSHGVELLRIQARPPEILSWSVNVEQSCKGAWAGVAVGNINKNKWLGGQAGGWVCGSNGSVCRGNPRPGDNSKKIEFSKGDTLHFLLDLSGEGTLSLAKNNLLPLVVFRNMCNQAADAVFVPAVSLTKPAVIVYLTSHKVTAAAVPSPGPAITEAEALERLRKFYKAVAPEKEKNVGKIWDSYGGKPISLFLRLRAVFPECYREVEWLTTVRIRGADDGGDEAVGENCPGLN